MAMQTPHNKDTIAQALDITPVDETKNLPVETEVPSNTEKDLEYARENYYHLIETGRRSLEDLVDVANQSQHPRAYEVVGQLMDKLTNANKELINMHKQVKDVRKEESGSSPQNVTNALFVGSTAELQKLLKDNKVG